MIGQHEQWIAASLEGDGEALRQLITADADGELARRHRVGSPLYLRALEQNLAETAPAGWRRDMAANSVRYMVLERALEGLAQALAEAGIPWLPLKGYDLATRVYESVEERPTSDLDLLIAESDLPRAQTVLRTAGWRDLAPGTLAVRYLTEEGYAWQASNADEVLLEIHFRLWGSVPAGLAPAMLVAATPDSDLPSGGRRLALAHAYLLAAVHVWLMPTPRGIGPFQDLRRLAEASPMLAAEVIREARDWGLHLPVSLASMVAAQLWQDATCREIADTLASELRWAERLALSRLRQQPLGASLGLMSLARLVSGRPSRHGARVLWRRFWVHPGTVEMMTPPRWPWLVRRLWLQLQELGCLRAARWLERLMARRPDRD